MHARMKSILCRGSPYDVGFSHGSKAADEIGRSIAFYAKLFLKYSDQTWPQVLETARIFAAQLESKWPFYYLELQGIANGSKRDILDIVALNVRSEIAFGLFSDGCTSLYWKTQSRVFLAQNWDWMEDQKPNLVHLYIVQPKLPAIQMITESGIIGKIGLNSAGVGVCFNAIRAMGLDTARIPVHIALRVALESASVSDAVRVLEEIGVASSVHILIGDAETAVGLEFTAATVVKLAVGGEGRIVHANHLVGVHEGAHEPAWLEDSPVRVERMGELARKIGEDPSEEEVSRLFEDEANAPGAICRAQVGKSETATLFNIVMELKEKRGVVRLGRPCEVEETLELSFDS